MDNQWSDPFTTVVNRLNVTTGTRQTYVAAANTWDTDPGVGNGIPVFAVDGGYNEAVEWNCSGPSTPP
ncbi:MAG: hypothetical protein U0176_11575 [Bacteroidia bacterium]